MRSTTPKVVQDEEAPIFSTPTQSSRTRIRDHVVDRKVSPSSDMNTKFSLEDQVRQKMTQPPGLRLIAHGIKVRPRPVWIQLHVEPNNSEEGDTVEVHNCLSWRAELKSSSPDNTSSNNNTPSLGSIRKVSLSDIVGIELGQKTVALKRLTKQKSVRESECFSILTNTGTLDLQCVPSPEFARASAQDVREACLKILRSVMMTGDGGGVETILSRTNTNTISTVTF